MTKKISLPEGRLKKLREYIVAGNKKVGHNIDMPNDDFASKDEYKIGGEGGNNDFFHVNEGVSKEQLKAAINQRPNQFYNWVVIYHYHYMFFQKKSAAIQYKRFFRSPEAFIINLDKVSLNEGYCYSKLANIDLSNVGTVDYSWDFDEEEYEEWLQDNELQDNEQIRYQYYKEEVSYDVSYTDNETYHYMASDYSLAYDDLEELFGEDMASRMLKNCIEDGEGSFEPFEIYENNHYDLNNPNELNDIAMKLLPHGEYYEGCRGFILSNGVVVYTESEHNEVLKIPGVESKFDFIRLGNVRIMANSIDIGQEPTYEQYEVIKQIVRYNSDGELYMDIFSESDEYGTRYVEPSYQKVIADIDRFYNEGIRPVNEGKELNRSFEEWFGNSVLIDKEGNPIKMYHGTGEEFDAFSKKYIGKTGAYEGYGFNFTPFYSRALSYNSKNVIEAYLKAEHPMTSKTHKITLAKLIKIIAKLDEGKPYTDTIVAAYEPSGYGEDWDERYYRRALPVAARTIYQYNKDAKYGDAGLYAELCVNGNADTEKTINTFEEMGFDSVIFYDNDDRINTVIVFEPYQIKKVGNKTFSLDSDIMSENSTRLDEYHNERNLPFEEPEFANKTSVEQFKDWLEEYGKYGNLGGGTLDFWDEIEKAVNIIRDKQLHGRFDNAFDKYKDVDEILDELEQYKIGRFIKITNDNKVYIERSVYSNYNYKNVSDNGDDQYFDFLVKNFNDNVGGCWSYREGGAKSYCGEGQSEIIMRGYIRTDDIDFIKTVQLNYHYENEHEIRVKPFAKIELINFTYDNYTVNFDKPLVVNAYYSGNNSQFSGNIGVVDDGFGNIKYINRKNEYVDTSNKEFLIQAIENGISEFLQDVAIGDFVIPDGVTSIGDFAFYRYSGLTSVTIPEGVTSIGDNAFESCRDLTSVIIPSSVKSIGSDAFLKCPKLTSMAIPDGVTSIGSGAFRYCYRLTSVTIGEGVTSIESQTFSDCSSLTSVTIPDGVTSIGSSVFTCCFSLKSVTIPSSVTKIGAHAFYICPNLTIYVQDEQTVELVRQSGFKGDVQLLSDNNRISEGMIKENIENEVNSDDINLKSFKIKKTLPCKLWNDDMTLDSKVRLKLLDIADDFWDFVNISWVEPKGIHLTGSICNYNWSNYSDIDLHIIVDFNDVDEKTDFVQEYFDSKKNEWNNEHEDLTIYGYRVELYVEDVDADTKSGGIYDLEANKWIRKPKPGDMPPLRLDKYKVKNIAADIMTKIDDLEIDLNDSNDKVAIEKIGDNALKLLGKANAMRKKGLERGGESDPLNIVYKVIKRTKYIDKLWDIVSQSYDKINSIRINESNSILLREYLDKDYNIRLYKYFKWAETASDCEKAEDLAYSNSYAIEDYIEKVRIKYPEFDDLLEDFDLEDEECIEKFLKILSDNNLCEDFINSLIYYCAYYDLPAWCFMDYIGIVKNEWCIHFTKDANSIAHEGFTGGTPDIERLAYTNAGSQKNHEGYDFAFKVWDRNVDFNEYGDEAVIFQTSGVEIYHHGDQQRQVVFWGPYAKNIIPIKRENGDWVVYGMNDQILKAADKPSEIVDWAIDNLPQYRKQIMVGKNGYVPKMYNYKQNKWIPIRTNL